MYDQSIRTTDEPFWQCEVITHSGTSHAEGPLHGRPIFGNSSDGAVATFNIDSDAKLGIAVVIYISGYVE